MEAQQWRREEVHNTGAWVAWHTAALMRAKKMPDLEKLLHKHHRRSKKQTVEEQIAMAKMLTSLFGGESKNG